MKTINIDVNQVAKKGGTTIRVRLTGFYQFRMRLWMVKKLLYVAAFISPVCVAIDDSEAIKNEKA